MGLISDDTNLSFVCEENLGSGTFTETTATNPSLASSPEAETFSFVRSPSLSIYLFIALVKAVLKPTK